MSVLQGIRSHYSLFGFYGLLLVAKARLLQRPVEVAVSVPGIKYPVFLRLRTADVTVFEQVLMAAAYDWEFSMSLRVIVDAGANIGLASVFYANKYPEAKILAIEPESSNYEMLKKNVAPYPNVIPLQGALWKENKELCLSNPNSRHDGFQIVDQPALHIGERHRRTVGFTMNEIMQNYNINFIDVLKLDIEGSEKEVFENPRPWIEKVGVIEIELHDWLRTGCSRSVYLSTKDFEFEFRKGETVFLLRREYVPDRVSPLGVSANSRKTGCYQTGANLPFKILGTA